MSKELLKRILSSLILIPIVFFFIIKGSIFFNLLIALVLLITLYEWHHLSLKKVYYLPGFIFIFFSFYTVYFFRDAGVSNYSFFWLIFLTCIGTDIGGYIFGKIFKGPKLTKISPNKTYAGMLGGFILSLIISICFIKFIYLSLFKLEYPYTTITKADEGIGLQTVLLVLSISFISQVGDLIISFFKRKLKIKNTGQIIPGHGGVLDRIDGMIFAFPYMYILLKII